MAQGKRRQKRTQGDNRLGLAPAFPGYSVVRVWLFKSKNGAGTGSWRLCNSPVRSWTETGGGTDRKHSKRASDCKCNRYPGSAVIPDGSSFVDCGPKRLCLPGANARILTHSAWSIVLTLKASHSIGQGKRIHISGSWFIVLALKASDNIAQGKRIRRRRKSAALGTGGRPGSTPKGLNKGCRTPTGLA
jgi:hypothetical protein